MKLRIKRIIDLFGTLWATWLCKLLAVTGALQDLCILIPAYNEERNVKQVIDLVRKELPNIPIIVVNDGSSDGTRIVARQTNVQIHSFVVNCGVGAVLKYGVKTAHEQGFKYAVVVDADGQHQPSEIMKIVNLISPYNPDIIVGSRDFKTYPVNKITMLGIRILRLIFKVKHKKHIPDPTSGFRVLNLDSIDTIIEKITSEYLDDTAGLISVALQNNLRIESTFVEMNIRTEGSPSHNPGQQLVKYINVLIRIIVGRS